MDVFYQKSAELDLEAIEDYYSQKSRRSFNNVLADISSTIDIIGQNPEAGRIIDKELSIRRLVSAKYRYSISYIPSETVIKIIGVFRGQDRRV